MVIVELIPETSGIVMTEIDVFVGSMCLWGCLRQSSQSKVEDRKTLATSVVVSTNLHALPHDLQINSRCV